MVVGDVELVALVDGTVELGKLSELFPDTADWSLYLDEFPEVVDGSSFLAPCASFLLRAGVETVLVDTGVGPAGLLDWPTGDEGLPRGLAAEGVAPEDVTVVVLTHLHVDHVGWNTDRDGRAFFPNARYVAHRKALAYARDGGRRPHSARTIEPIEFEEVDGEVELAPGVSTVQLAGHYPGHLGVRVASAGGSALLIGDAAVHPLQLDRPRDSFANDVDTEVARATREALVAELVDQDVLVASSHFPNGGVGRAVRENGRVLWTPA